MKISITLLLLGTSLSALATGPFPPAANQQGTTAIANDDPKITRWASSVAAYLPGQDLDEMWQDTRFALTPATANPTFVTSLGRGGQITLEFDPPIRETPGPDFAVFENSFAHTFLELAFVEVSADGLTYQRFPNSSLTPNPVGPFGLLDPTEIDGLAGKYIGGFGTPFDLLALPTPLPEIRFVRLIDVTGGTSRDSDDLVIFDPFPTQGSAGFDLAGIAVLVAPPSILSTHLSEENLIISWATTIGQSYLIESSPNLLPPWTAVREERATESTSTISVPTNSSAHFYRISLAPN